MRTNGSRSILQHIRRLVSDPAFQGPTDRDLLHRFANTNEQAAFEEILRRHGPMVLGVCTRVLGNDHDAEDAFQATFLVLADKAGAIGWQDSVGNWLYIVAHRLALRARAQRSKRASLEKHADVRDSEDPRDAITLREAQTILDEELARLPRRYRAPILLCCLSGATRDEAAQQLGWSLATLKRRLEQGRKLLRTRIERRSLTLPAVLAGALVGEGALSAAVPSRLVQASVGCVMQKAGAGAATSTASLLAQGMLQTMAWTKIKWAAVTAIVLIGLAGVGAGLVPRTATVAPEPQPQLAANEEPQKQEKADRQGDPLPPDALMRLGTKRWRQSQRIHALGVLAGDKTLVTSTDSGTLRLWDRDTGEVRKTLEKSGRLAVSPDGKWMALEDSRVVELLNAETGELAQTMVLPNTRRLFECPLVSFSPDGKHIAIATNGREVGIWDRMLGKEGIRVQAGESLAHMGFADAGKQLLTVDNSKTCLVRIWDASTGKELRAFRVVKDDAEIRLRPMAFSPDGSMLALEGAATVREKHGPDTIVYTSYKVHLVDVRTGQIRHKLDSTSEVIWSAAFSADSKKVGCLRMDGTVEVWDTLSGTIFCRTAPNPSGSPPERTATIAFSLDGNAVAAAVDTAVHLYDVKTGTEVGAGNEGHDAAVKAVAYSPDGTLLASAAMDHRIALWDAATGRSRGQLIGHTRSVLHLAFSPDGKLLASSSDDNTVRLWELATNKSKAVLQEPRGQQPTYRNFGVKAVAFSPDGKTLTAWGEDLMLRRWEVETGKELLAAKILPSVLTFPKDDPTRPEYSMIEGDHISAAHLLPDMQIAILGSNRGISLIQTQDGKEVFKFDCPDLYKRFAVSPDGRCLAVGTFRGHLFLYELATGQEILHREWKSMITALAFSTDGRRLVASVGGKPESFRVLDVATGNELPTLGKVPSRVSFLAFSPSGRAIASAQEDTTVMLWDAAKAPTAATSVKKQLTQHQVESLWVDLALADGAKSNSAFWLLATNVEQAMPFLAEQLKPAVTTTPEKALSPWKLEDAEAIRRSRAIGILEQIGSRPAEKLLLRLAEGAPTAIETLQAKAALQRLAKRHEMPRS